MNILWSPEATEDLISLRAYCGRRSYYHAAGRAAHHTERRELLPDNPQIGRAGRVPGTREFAIPRTPYIVPYRFQRTTIQILRVYHGARIARKGP
jgi:toxin ParE1/3/4